MARSEKMKKILQIMELAVEINKGKPNTFVRFSGHVDDIEVDIHYDGWETNKSPDKQMSAYLSGELCKLSDLNNIIKELKKIKAKECK